VATLARLNGCTLGSPDDEIDVAPGGDADATSLVQLVRRLLDGITPSLDAEEARAIATSSAEVVWRDECGDETLRLTIKCAPRYYTATRSAKNANVQCIIDVRVGPVRMANAVELRLTTLQFIYVEPALPGAHRLTPHAVVSDFDIDVCRTRILFDGAGADGRIVVDPDVRTAARERRASVSSAKSDDDVPVEGLDRVLKYVRRGFQFPSGTMRAVNQYEIRLHELWLQYRRHFDQVLVEDGIVMGDA